MFPQCPPVGNDTGCGFLVTVNADGSTTVAADPAQPASGYDGAEDTLVAVQNNATKTIRSVNLSSSTSAFAFDGDGLCNTAQWPSAPPTTPPGCPGPDGFGPTGYEGPNTTFSNLTSNSGTVNFTAPLRTGQSAYFGLEEALQAGQLQAPPVDVVAPKVTVTAGIVKSCSTGKVTLTAQVRAEVDHVQDRQWQESHRKDQVRQGGR